MLTSSFANLRLIPENLFQAPGEELGFRVWVKMLGFGDFRD